MSDYTERARARLRQQRLQIALTSARAAVLVLEHETQRHWDARLAAADLDLAASRLIQALEGVHAAQALDALRTTTERSQALVDALLADVEED